MLFDVIKLYVVVCLHLRNGVELWQDALRPEQTVEVILVIFGISWVEAAHVDPCQRVDKLLVTHIYAHMRHMCGLLVCGLASEEHEVARLQVAEVGSNLNVLTHLGLLRCVARRTRPLQSTALTLVPPQ